MSPQQWIAFGFAALLIIFLIAAYFAGSRLEPQQWQILRFLCALTAAFAGWFISGAVIINYAQQLASGGKLSVQGSAGMGLFILVWFTFKVVSPSPPPDFAFSIPAGWSLGHVAHTLGVNDKATVDLSALSPTERNAILRPVELRTGTVLKALQALGGLTENVEVRPYTVTFEAPTYTFRV